MESEKMYSLVLLPPAAAVGATNNVENSIGHIKRELVAVCALK